MVKGSLRRRLAAAGVAVVLVVGLLVGAGAGDAGASLTSLVIGGDRPLSVDISGTRVVWADRSSGADVYDVFLYDGRSGITTRLTDGTRDDLQPRIDGDTVVWVSYSVNGTGADIHAYDIPSRTLRVVCEDPGDQVAPALSGRWVVWEDRSTGYAPSVRAADLATGTRFTVASSQSQPKRRPAVGGNVVVFEDYPRGSAFDADVVAFDLSSRTVLTRIGDASAGELRPDTDGTFVVWERAETDGVRDIAGMNLATGVTFTVAEGAAEQAVPAVDSGVAYWFENAAGKRLGVLSRALPAGAARPVNTFGSGRGALGAYAAGGGGVAWIENTGDGRVVRAILGAPSAGGSSALADLLPTGPAWLPFRLAQISTGGDVEPPAVVATNVEPGATLVDPDAAFTVSFSKPLDSATVSATSVTLSSAETGEAIDATVRYSALSRSITLTPEEPLGDGTFALVVEDSVADTSGNTLEEPVEIALSTTVTLADTTAPRVPGTGGARVAAEAGQDAVEVTWAKPWDNVGVTEYLIYAHTAPMTLTTINTLGLTPVATVATDPATPVGAPEAAIVSVPGARDSKFTYYYAIRARDGAGNVSALSANRVADPHGTNVFGANLNTCTMCHGVHGSTGGGTGVMSAGRLAARSAEACFTCHGGTAFATAYGHGSSIDVQARFYSYESSPLPEEGSQHRNEYMVSQQQECDACHTPHKKPYDGVAANSFNKLLKRQTGTGLAYNTDAAPFGNQFCFSCHGTSMAAIADVGGADAYANTAGDHNAAAFDTDPSVAHGSANVFPTRLPSEAGPQISCTACHNEHASPVARLIDYRGTSTADRNFDQAELCFECHSGSSTEARSAGSAPFAWNNRDVKAEFGRAESGGSSHPVSITGPEYVLTSDAVFSQTLVAEFFTNTHFQTRATTGDGGGSIELDTYVESDPPPLTVIYGQEGSDRNNFARYAPGDNTWSGLGRAEWAPGSGSTSVFIDDKLYMTRGGGSNSRAVYDPATGMWSGTTNAGANIGVGGDAAQDAARSFVYLTRAGNSNVIMKWRYSDDTFQTAINFRDNGGVNQSLGAGSAIAFVPGSGDGRLFVVNRNGGANDGRLYYTASPYNKSGNVNFTQGPQVTSSGTTAYHTRMARANVSGTEYLFILGRNASNTRNLQVVANVLGTPTLTQVPQYPFGTNDLGDGCQLIWDGGQYLYALRGGGATGFSRIAIPENPANAASWGAWQSLAGPAWGSTWAAGSSIAVGSYDPPPVEVHFASGTATTAAISAPGTPVSWGAASWVAEVPSGTALTVTAQGFTGSTWVPLASSATSPIDLSGFSKAAYPEVRLVASLSTADSYVSPRIDEWQVTATFEQRVEVGQLSCYSCHNTHYVKKGTAGQAWQMSRASDPANTRTAFTGTSTDFCLRCHGGSVPQAVVSAGTLVPYDVEFREKSADEFPYFFGWNKQLPGARFTESSHFTTAGTKALCQNCHDPHASDFNRLVSWTRPASWATGNAGTRANTGAGTLGQVNICYQCHGDGTNNTKLAPGAKNVYTAARQAYSHPISLSQAAVDAKHSGAESPVDLGAANRHAECNDCHDPHAAKKVGGSPLHVQGTSTAGGALVGAVGVKPVWTSGQWSGATSYERVRISGAAADYEAYVCFKCHTGNTNLPSGKRDLSFEFNPANESGHNVIGNVWPKTAGLGPTGTYTFGFPATRVFAAGWNENSMMTCSDCHTYSTTGARGPHGSNVAFMIDPAYPNPYRNDPARGSSNNAQLSSGSPTGMSMSNGGGRANIICEKCHVIYSGGGWAHAAHADHRRGANGGYCNFCHSPVPHGWVRPRLLAYRSDPEPYRTIPGGLTRITLRNYTPSSWSNKDLCGAECSTGRHPLNEPFPNNDSPTLSWP